MRYAMARYSQYQRDVAYRVFVSDCLRIMTENTAKYSGGSYVKHRYADIMKPRRVDNRTAEQIVADVVKLAGLEVI